MNQASHDLQLMLKACHLAERAKGIAEPNPTVGSVIVQEGRIVGKGWTQKFGGDHAEVHAIRGASVPLDGATLYVTLEPCCHHGKTPPCTDAILNTGITRVVVGVEDPFPAVAGKGIEQLRAAGIQVDVVDGLPQLRHLIAPFGKLQTSKRPWLIAKWAMTLDGKIATRTGSSQWISSPESRQLVHDIRGRMDGIMVGIGTALADDPQLTARPAGPRTATRIVVDSLARLSIDSHLVRTARTTPTLVAVSSSANADRIAQLKSNGVEVLVCQANSPSARVTQLLDELGSRDMTNVLVEGGGTLLGTLFDDNQVDEVHAFVAPKLCGGATAVGPVLGKGIESMSECFNLAHVDWHQLGPDLHLHGLIEK